MNLEEYKVMYQVEQTLWWYRGMRTIARAILDEYCRTGQEITILDTGCGTGNGMVYMRDYGTIVGLDHLYYALALAQQRNVSLLSCGSVTALPFKPASFDVVTSWDVLPMLSGDQDQQFLHEAARVLVPGGRLFVRVAAYDWLRGAHDRAWDVVHRYSAQELRAKIAQTRMMIEHLSYANMWLLPLAIIKRSLEPFFSPQNGSDLTLDVGPLNELFAFILSSEAKLVARHSLPLGLSIVAVAVKTVSP